MAKERILHTANRTSFVKFNVAAHSDNIIPIVFNDPSLIRNQLGLTTERGLVNGYIKSLGCNADTPNLPEQSLPDLPDEATDIQRLAAQKEVEWHSPRFVVAYWISKVAPSAARNNRPDGPDWIWSGHHSVVNIGEAWRQYDAYAFFSSNLAFGLEERDSLGFSILATQVQNADGSFTTYFPRTSEPYTLPANRADRLIFTCEWKQELEISQDTSPLVIYVGSSTTAGSSTTTQTPVTPPTVTFTAPSTYAGAIYHNENLTLTIAVSKLTPNTDFFLQYVSSDGTTIYKTDTVKSDASGNYTATINSNIFGSSPFPGTASYKIRATQGSVAGESAALAIKVTAVTTNPTPVETNGGSFNVVINGVRPGQPVVLTLQKNGVDMSGWTQNYTVGNATNGTDSGTATYSASIFASTGWGVGSTNVYRVKLARNGVVTLASNTFTAQTTTTSTGNLG